MERKLRFMFLATIAVLALLGSSAAQTSHTVGGSLGWTVPQAGESAYTSWARNQSFGVGDALVFTFPSGSHTVAEVRRADFDACNINNPTFTITNGPATVVLNATGSHYYICTVPGHCSAGQKLQINVSAATSSSPAPQPASPAPRAPSPAPQSASPVPTASSPAPQSASPTPTASPPAPSPATTPSSVPAASPTGNSPSPVTNSSPAPAPSRNAATYTVGDGTGWTIPSGGASAYQTWARDKTFVVGDVLVFNYPNGAHDVAEVTSQSYQSCSGTNPISLGTTPPTRITLTTAGEHYFICTFNGHCASGQRLDINVTGTGTATPPSPSSSVPSAPSPAGSPGSSATSLGVAGVSATLFSLVVAMFFV